MKIQLEYLLKTVLLPLGVRYSRSDAPVLDFNEVCLIAGPEDFAVRRLHVGRVSQLPQQPPALDGPLLLLCLEDAPVPEPYLTGKNVILLLCPPEAGLAGLFNRMNSLFSAAAESADALWAFLGKVAAGASFTELMGFVAETMDCSCALLSQGFKVLGFCQRKEESAGSRSWQATIQHRYYPHTELISRLQPNGLTVFDPETHRIAPDPRYYPPAGDAFFPLVSEDSSREILGFLYFSYTQREKLISRLYAIQFVAYALSFRMWRYINAPSHSNAPLCFLLRDIINGALTDDDEIDARLKNIKFSNYPYNYLVTIFATAMDSRRHSWAHLKTVFGQLFPEDVLFTYNGDILLLISSSEDDVLTREKLAALTRMLKDHGCFAGISPCFAGIDRSLKNHYARTLAAAKMARLYNMEDRFTTYEEVALLHFIQEGAAMENQKDLCDPRILRLAAYDHAHASNYIYTLQCYWHFNQNIQRTCDHLFIHRNTLFYRLKKIKEIADLDVNNSKHLILFNLSFSILTVLGDIPYTDFSVQARTEDFPEH